MKQTHPGQGRRRSPRHPDGLMAPPSAPETLLHTGEKRKALPCDGYTEVAGVYA